MSASFLIQKFAKVFRVGKVTIHTDRDSKRRVDVEGLGFRPTIPSVSDPTWYGPKGNTYADDVPMVG